MWPFRSKPEPNPASLANLRRGNAPATPAKAVEREADALEATTKVTNSLFQFVDAFDKRINDKIAAMTPVQASEDDGGYTLMDVIAEIMPHVGPYIGPYVGPLLEKYAGVTPNVPNTPNPPAQVGPSGHEASQFAPGEGLDMIRLISAAAKTPENVLKVAMPVLRDELTNRNIDINEFKSACQKIGKVL